jgi:hypothetical protein
MASRKLRTPFLNMAYELGNEEENIKVFSTLDYYDMKEWFKSVQRPMTTDEQNIYDITMDDMIIDSRNQSMRPYGGG